MNHDETSYFTQYFEQPYQPNYYQLTDNGHKNNTYTFQTDYVYPFDDSTKIETGLKATLQTMNSQSGYYTKSDSISYWINDPTKSNDFIYDEDIYAAYAIFLSHFDNFLYSFGLRIEQTVTKGNQVTINQVDREHYLDFFPSATIGYKLNPLQQIQISYSRRIERPHIWHLNPFVEYIDYYNVMYGNPNLKPQYVDMLELGLIQNFSKFTITPSIFYNRTTDDYDRITVLMPNGIIGTTWDNISTRYSYGFEFNLSGETFKWMKLSLNGSYYKYIVEGNKNYSGQTQSDYSWNARLNATIMPMKPLSFQVTGFYRAPTLTVQGKRFGFYSIDIGARYDVLNNLSILFRAGDIFHTMVFHNTSSGVDFFFENNMNRLSQAFSVGLQYKINEGIKQREKPINNEGGGEDDSLF